MTRRVLALQWVFIALLAASTVACGNSKSPTGPTGLSSGGAIISGRVNVTGSAAATVAARFPLAVGVWAGVVPLASTTSSTVTVTIVGTDVSTTVDGGGSFTLTGVPPGTVQLRFQGRGADATLTISGVEADDTLRIEVTLNGSSARLDSREKTSKGNGNGNGNGGNNGNGVDVNGRIDSIDVAARTVRVEGSTVLVTSSTVIRHGNQTLRFADLRVGDHVQVKGARNGSMVTASEVKVEQGGDGDDDDDDDRDDLDRIEFRGTVSLLTGLCPGLTMTVSGLRVVTNAATLFAPTPCNMLRNDMLVTVQGIRRSDGSVLASSVAAEDSSQAVVRGTVSLLVGLCPGLTFTVAATQVVTNAATQFEDVTCAGLQNQMTVEVRGVRRNDGSLLATRVDRD